MTSEHCRNEHALTSEARSNVSNILLENSFEAVLVTDMKGQILYTNPAVSRSFGYRLEDLYFQSVFDVFTVSEDDQNKLLKVCDKDILPESEIILPGFIKSSGGDQIDVQLRSFVTEISSQRQFTFLVRDISARVSISRELESSQQLMGSIVAGVGDAIIATDQNGYLTLFNRGAEDTFGYRTDDILGKHLNNLIPEEHRGDHSAYMTDFDAGAIDTRGMGARGAISGLRENGEVFPAEATIIKIGKGKQQTFAAVVRDVSERIKVQNQLREAKEMAEIASQMKSSFLANMSHELRTPLNAIIGFSEFITEEHLGPIAHPKYREYIGDILDSGRHLLTIVNDILDLSRVEAGEIQLNETVMCVRQSILSAYRFVKRQAKVKNITLDAELGDDLPYLFADERLIKQVIINLVTNAVKFTPDGGLIKAEIRRVDEDNGIAIVISDTGIGIAKDDIERVIKPFEQCESSYTKTIEGTGLGLSLARSLMHLHGGDLSIESEVGLGTSVVLNFPVDRVVAKETALTGLQSKTSVRKLTA
ncbi:PAS domain-containing sensor histidine kinase [Kiloniella sp. EL199]|uniref:PAS domain-containing sensor histidine kinase n=1 Tax=Kiloniella sp. EL199 TaxID=2107581 RepID=UPI000EA0F7FE|nr:PAS domain S-box protein [Kiloniella sp. EL199]